MACIGRTPIALDSKAKVRAIARASLEKKATDVTILHVAKLTSVADYLVICSGESERQVKAIADHIDTVLSSERLAPMNIEGTSTAQWVLMDFGDVVVHVFRSDIRDHYGLEKLWRDARRVPLQGETPAAAVASGRAVRSRTVRVRRQG